MLQNKNYKGTLYFFYLQTFIVFNSFILEQYSLLYIKMKK